MGNVLTFFIDNNIIKKLENITYITHIRPVTSISAQNTVQHVMIWTTLKGLIYKINTCVSNVSLRTASSNTAATFAIVTLLITHEGLC